MLRFPAVFLILVDFDIPKIGKELKLCIQRAWILKWGQDLGNVINLSMAMFSSL